MPRWAYYFLILAFLGGCTPLSENVVRKTEAAQPAVDEASQDPPDLSASTGQDPLLDWRTQDVITSYGPTIKRYSAKYGFDWRLVLAIIKQESRFSPDAESYKGASGLMQMMPVTGEEVAKILDLQDVSHPKDNIRGGIFYLNKLYGLFVDAPDGDRIKLTLAAYNAGIGRIYDAQDIAAYMFDNPMRWQAVKDALPLLSKRYRTLHENVWHEDHPRTGWFGNSRETIAYVDSVMDYYDEFREVLD